MLAVAVIIYNRYHNLIKWVHCWKQCYHLGFELIVIHNDNGQAKQFRGLCELNNIKYIRRENIGFDIGAMQDVFKDRLKGFPNSWRYLLWCTDDVIPMQKDFISPFTTHIENGVGVAAMHISPEKKPHVRTGCFMIGRPLASQIEFPADPITTKKQCYEFEHGENCFSDQVRKLGFSCVMVAPLMESPMYDTEYWTRNKQARFVMRRYNRDNEHKAIFYQK